MSVTFSFLRLRAFTQALQAAVLADEHAGAGPLQQARAFLWAHLPEQLPLPSWVTLLQDQLLQEPSPHVLWQWEHERQAVLDGLYQLERYWLGVAT
jgi:hypothetical protein